MCLLKAGDQRNEEGNTEILPGASLTPALRARLCAEFTSHKTDSRGLQCPGDIPPAHLRSGCVQLNGPGRCARERLQGLKYLPGRRRQSLEVLSLTAALGKSMPCVGSSQPSVDSSAAVRGRPTPEASQRAWLTYGKEGSVGPSTTTCTGVWGEEVGSLATN